MFLEEISRWPLAIERLESAVGIGFGQMKLEGCDFR